MSIISLLWDATHKKFLTFYLKKLSQFHQKRQPIHLTNLTKRLVMQHKLQIYRIFMLSIKPKQRFEGESRTQIYIHTHIYLSKREKSVSNSTCITRTPRPPPKLKSTMLFGVSQKSFRCETLDKKAA